MKKFLSNERKEIFVCSQRLIPDDFYDENEDHTLYFWSFHEAYIFSFMKNREIAMSYKNPDDYIHDKDSKKWRLFTLAGYLDELLKFYKSINLEKHFYFSEQLHAFTKFIKGNKNKIKYVAEVLQDALRKPDYYGAGQFYKFMAEFAEGQKSDEFYWFNGLAYSKARELSKKNNDLFGETLIVQFYGNVFFKKVVFDYQLINKAVLLNSGFLNIDQNKNTCKTISN